MIRVPAKLPLVTVSVSRPLWRVHQSHLDPVWFGPGSVVPPPGRFDDPALGFGVCYFGETPGVSVLEALVRGAEECLVDRTRWEARSITRIGLAEPLRMLQFEGKRLPQFGVGMDRASAADHGECQQLSAEIHASFPSVDGIQYRSRWDPEKLCWALFARASRKVVAAGPPVRLAGSALGDEALDAYSILLM
jgi:hypothetical protein